MRLGALAFFHFFFSAPLSPRFLSSAPSSPRPFFWVHFRALIFLSSFFTWIGHPSHWDPFFVFFHLGRSPITIRPLLNKKQKKQKKQQKKTKKFFWSSSKWLVSWFLHFPVKVIFQSTVFKTKKKKEKFFLYLLFFINLLHKAKGKWNFPISLHSKYYKQGETVITQFFTLLFLLLLFYLLKMMKKNDEKK